MSVGSYTRAVEGKPASERPFGGIRKRFRSISSVMRVARGRFGGRLAPELALRCGTSVRACEFWMARHAPAGLSADALAMALCSDLGPALVDALVADYIAAGNPEPEWHAAFRTHLELAAIRRDQARQRQRLNELEQSLRE